VLGLMLESPGATTEGWEQFAALQQLKILVKNYVIDRSWYPMSSYLKN